MTVRAAIYLRVSQDRLGEHLAVSRQLEDCQVIAAQRGWNVVEIFEDNSISASIRTIRRPAYDRMVEAFDRGEFDALICYDLDRLTRQPRQLEDWIDRAEERGLRLVTANGEADLTTDAGRLFARIKASVARSEVERKSARQKRAATQRAQLGKPPAGVRLTGYTMDGELISEEAAAVARVFDSFLAGVPLTQIAAMLNEGDVPARGAAAGTAVQRERLRGVPGTWRSSTVRGILTNPRYAGHAVHRGVILSTRGLWEPIVSEAAFDAVQVKLSDPARRTHNGDVSRRYIGSGLFRCGVCMDRVTVRGRGYSCMTGGHATRSVDRVNSYVVAVMMERLRRPDIGALLTPADDGAALRLDAQIETLRSRLSAVDSDYDAGLIDGVRFRAATDRITDELRKLEGQRARAVGGGLERTLSAPDPAAAFEQASLEARRSVIDVLAEVILHRSSRGRGPFDPASVEIRWRG